MASSERTKNQSKEINFSDFIGLVVEITYKDHVYFKNYDFSKIEPCFRKTVGWLMTVCTDHVVICHDIGVEILGERRDCGFSLIKTDILKISELEVPRKSFKQNLPSNKRRLLAIKIGDKEKCKS